MSITSIPTPIEPFVLFKNLKYTDIYNQCTIHSMLFLEYECPQNRHSRSNDSREPIFESSINHQFCSISRELDRPP